MTTFTRAWTDAYIAIPDDNEDALHGASRIREVKNDIRERMLVDHEWAGDENDGKHRTLHMRPLVADPTTLPAHGQLYVKMQGANIELYYKDDKGNVFPITSAGGGIANIILPGTILAFGNAVDADGTSYIQCDGRAISRTAFGGLFFAIGAVWGPGDGVTTFNVPDLRGRAPIGRGLGTYVGATNRIAGQSVGKEKVILDIQEVPGHVHYLGTNQASNVAGASPGVLIQGASGASNTVTQSAGGDPGTGVAHEHENMQPSAVINWWIKT